MSGAGRRRRAWLPWAALALVVAAALAVGVSRDDGARTDDERIRALSSEVACPTCRGQSVIESDAPAAAAIRGEIRRRVTEGESDDDVRAFLVSRYGEAVLLTPRAGGLTGLVWAIPVVVLIVALAGLVAAFRRWRADGSLDADSYADLLKQRDFLLRSLEDLERERAAGDIDEHDYRTLREDYTARAAVVLRAIGEGRAAIEAPRPSRPLRALAVAAAIAMGAMAAGAVVAASSGTRLPGDTITGNIRETTPQKLNRAAALVQQGQAVEAIQIYDEILADNPDHAEALRNRGWILVQAGLIDEGLVAIERALDLDPDNPDALFFRARALQLRGDLDEAAATYRRFLATPGLPAEVRELVEALLAEAEG